MPSWPDKSRILISLPDCRVIMHLPWQRNQEITWNTKGDCFAIYRKHFRWPQFYNAQGKELTIPSFQKFKRFRLDLTHQDNWSSYSKNNSLFLDDSNFYVASGNRPILHISIKEDICRELGVTSPPSRTGWFYDGQKMIWQ